jgi:hypothetical protein
MTLNTQAMNDTHESAPSRDWRRRSLTRVAVCLLSWWACGVSYAAPLITFPSLPLQTGVTQPAPNIIFILDGVDDQRRRRRAGYGLDLVYGC